MSMKHNNLKNLKQETDESKEPLGIYVHIPFCERKCNYCDFLSNSADQDTINSYIDALIQEIKSYKGRNYGYQVETIFIGGGTPSSIDAFYIMEILKAIYDTFEIKCSVNHSPELLTKAHMMEMTPEITIEINPGTINRDKLMVYKEMGINRLSFGLQSTDNKELSLLGRIHSFEEFEDNYRLARSIGFQNINIDLMTALPKQTLESWMTTLEKIIALQPEHISAYSLIIEEDTPFYEIYRDGTSFAKDLPEEELDRLMYRKTKVLLQEHGYHRYEISNYARDGHESKHNISYWIGTQYLGLGLGSASLIQDTRFQNSPDIKEYINKIQSKLIEDKNKNDGLDHENKNALLQDIFDIRTSIDILTERQKMEEFMFLGLRMNRGIPRIKFYEKFGVEISKIYGEVIDDLIRKGLLYMDGEYYSLTEYGVDISNAVLARFL